MIAHALVRARSDRRINRSCVALCVLLWCHENLDTVRFREVRAWQVADGTGFDERPIRREMQKLVRYGYLDRINATDPNKAPEYRVVPAPPGLLSPPMSAA